MEKLLFGAAYYDEYMPCERLDEDIALMKKQELIRFVLQNPLGVLVNPRRVCLTFLMWREFFVKWRRQGSG